MALEKVSQRVAALRSVSTKDQLELITLLNSLIDGVRAVTTILDDDVGVTSTGTTDAFDAQVLKS